MCIIVDINTLSSVFSPTAADHEQFKVIYKYITTGVAKMTIGGTKFESELAATKKFLKIINIMKSSNRVVRADDRRVDKLFEEIEREFPDAPGFNDKHIVALCFVSGAKVVCTNDRVLKCYLKDGNQFYSRGKTIPKIFNSRTRPRDLPAAVFKRKCRLCS